MTDALRAQAKQAFRQRVGKVAWSSIGLSLEYAYFEAGYEAAARELARVTAERDAALMALEEIRAIHGKMT